MAEEAADDEALYDVWRRLTPEQVNAVHDVVAVLAERRRTHPGRPTRSMIDDALSVRDGPLRLGFLPVIADILANA